MSGPELKVFVCGDVMTGRGIDQILRFPCSPELFESWVTDARDYVRLAERRNGPIHQPVAADYVWGSALDELNRFGPEIRIANLETSITTCNSPWPGPGCPGRNRGANRNRPGGHMRDARGRSSRQPPADASRYPGVPTAVTPLS